MTAAPVSPVTLPTAEEPRGVSGTAGMIVFLAGVTVTFIALVIAYLVVAMKLRIDAPLLPWVFWVSTFVVLVSSVFLNFTVQATRIGRADTAHRSLLTATGLGYLFLGLQAPGLIMLTQLKMTFLALSPALFALTIALVALHMVHVIGGVAYLSVASLRSEKKHYESGDIGRLRPMIIYWHYMAVLWVILFSLVLIVR